MQGCTLKRRPIITRDLKKFSGKFEILKEAAIFGRELANLTVITVKKLLIFTVIWLLKGKRISSIPFNFAGCYFHLKMKKYHVSPTQSSLVWNLMNTLSGHHNSNVLTFAYRGQSLPWIMWKMFYPPHVWKHYINTLLHCCFSIYWVILHDR